MGEGSLFAVLSFFLSDAVIWLFAKIFSTTIQSPKIVDHKLLLKFTDPKSHIFVTLKL